MNDTIIKHEFMGKFPISWLKRLNEDNRSIIIIKIEGLMSAI